MNMHVEAPVETPSSATTASLKEFLNENGAMLVKKAGEKFQPVYDSKKDTEDRDIVVFKQQMWQLLRDPLAIQKDAILAGARALKTGDAIYVIGEMGTGKTYVSLGIAYLALPVKSRILVMCPSHLINNWRNEIKMTLPDAKVINLNRASIEDLEQLKKPASRREIYLIGEGKAKLSYSRRPVFMIRQGESACPSCGTRFSDMDEKDMRQSKLRIVDQKPDVSNGKRPTCPVCSNSLWEADRTKFRRIAFSEYVKNRIGGQVFDLFIADECHLYNGGTASRGQAFANFINASKKTIGCTGTLMGGYASNLNYLFRRTHPEMMLKLAGNDYHSPAEFVRNFGILEFVEKVSDGSNNGGDASCGRSVRTTTRERPGINPILFPHLLERCIFIRLQDVTKHLPGYAETFVPVPMSSEQREEYRQLEERLRDLAQAALAAGSKKWLGKLINCLLAYPDGCNVRGEVVKDFNELLKEEVVVAEAPKLDIPVLPKDEVLAEKCLEYKRQGLKTMVFLEHTGTRDLQPKLESYLKRSGLRVLVMRSKDARPEFREEWLLKKIKDQDPDVVICNPSLVETGLNLLMFPRIIYYQVGTKPNTFRQSSRRSWRIGQTLDVTVEILGYEETMQVQLVNLMANKIQTSLLVEGELSDTGLAELADGESSLIVAMAKALTDHIPADDAGNINKILAKNLKAENQGNGRIEDLAADVEKVVIPVKNPQTGETIQIAAQRKKWAEVHHDAAKGYAVAQTSSGIRFILRKGEILWNETVVGRYTSDGLGNIRMTSKSGKVRHKRIQLVPQDKKAGHYILYMLRILDASETASQTKKAA